MMVVMPMGVLIGIVGKPSAGKTTFLNAVAGTNAKTADYPFTTIKPNTGVGHVTIECVCKELNQTCTPKTGYCQDGVRFIPIKLIDVAGLVPGAHEGRGMGNQFLSDLAEADALIHIVDCSGSLSSDGEDVEPGSHDPMEDVKFLEDEIAFWMAGILGKGWDRIVRKAQSQRLPIAEVIAERLSGLKIKRDHVERALQSSNLKHLEKDKAIKWTTEDLVLLCREIQRVGKPIVIGANKIDRPTAPKHFDHLKQSLPMVVPMSALAELVLQRFKDQKKIEYDPLKGKLKIIGELKKKEEDTVQKIKENILEKYGSTGVYQILNFVAFNVLNLVAVYPVADVTHFTDQDGNVLPDVFLVPKGTTSKEFAAYIHQDLAKNFIHAIDARTHRRISDKYELQHRDIIKIVAAV